MAAAARPSATSDEQEDSRSSSSTNSPLPADNEESDFFIGANDSQSSLGVPNIQDMQVDDSCWPPVNRLPNEIFISIFSRLSSTSDLYNCMLVSKRWARNAVDLLWHQPACANWKNHSVICQTLGLEQPFFSYRDFIKRLKLAALADKVNDGSVLPLAVCTRVERLTLTNCRGLTDSGLIALVRNNPALLALDISNDKNITEESIKAISQNCKRLQGLNISGCENVSNESMLALAESCKYIKRLKLNECVQLRDNAIHAFAENCPNILEIDLHQCNQIGNGPVTSLLAKGNCLRELRLANCDLIDDDAFLSLPPGRIFEHLRILDLTSCSSLTDAAVEKIIDVAPRLRNLVLAKCRHITDAAVNAIAKLGKNLHYVHLGHCAQITDEGVKRLVHCCNRIRYIDLGCCSNLTDESVKRLALLPKLKRIGLVKCNAITDESVFALAEAAYRPRVRRDATGYYVGGEYYASSLERVHLSYCINLTLKSIMRLLNSCPRLTHLSLTGVHAFQRDDFQPYCRQAPPEFTPHQRDVFCVFSGNMVSKFRDFLNTSPQFKDLQDSYPALMGVGRMSDASRRAASGTGHRANGVGGDGMDDEMADDDNDFEGLDPGEMVLDAQNQNPANGDGNAGPAEQSIPVPPPIPLLGQYPFLSEATMGDLEQQYIQQALAFLDSPHFENAFSNNAAGGAPNPYAPVGFASVASVGQTSSTPQASMTNGNTVGGASTAPIHHASQQLPQDEPQQQHHADNAQPNGVN